MATRHQRQIARRVIKAILPDPYLDPPITRGLAAARRAVKPPARVCPVIAAFLGLRDGRLPDEAPLSFWRYIRMVIGSRGDLGIRHARALLAVDWLVREQCVAWLKLVGADAHAEVLLALPQVTAMSQIAGVLPIIKAVADDVVSARAIAEAGISAPAVEFAAVCSRRSDVSGVCAAAVAAALVIVRSPEKRDAVENFGAAARRIVEGAWVIGWHRSLPRLNWWNDAQVNASLNLLHRMLKVKSSGARAPRHRNKPQAR